MGTNKKYWKGLPQLNESPEFLKHQQNEFVEELPITNSLSDKAATSRRDFLKVVGFSTAAAALASCETPVIKSIPYVVKPEEVTPGVANFYASTFYDGHDYASVLVKTQEGRPIKIESNDAVKHTQGTNARTQSSVLGLYDNARLTAPHAKGSASDWKTVDKAIKTALASVGTGEIALLSSTIISPSTRSVLAEFKAKYPTAKVHQYDAVSYSALCDANEKTFGKKVTSTYNFEKANKVVVGIAADFLGTWLAPTVFASAYGKNRKVTKEKPEMVKHYQFEANLSLTGSNADERYMIKPSEIGKAVVALYNEVAKATGNQSVPASGTIASNADAPKALAKVAKELAAAKGQSLVVCGLNDVNVQILVNGINKMLDNYDKTVSYEMSLNTKQGDDQDFANLVADMNAGKVAAIITLNTNPVYTAPAKLGFAAAYKKVATKISLATTMDETAQLADYVCPDHNWLESWGDANPVRGHYSLQQPTINPIFSKPRYQGTRQAQDSLLKWAGVKTDYLTYLQAYWQNHVFPMQGKYGDFYSFWSNTLHDGVLHVNLLKASEMATVEPMPKDSSGKPLMTGIATVIADSLVSAKEDKKEIKEEKKVLAADEKKEEVKAVDYSGAAAAAVATKGGTWELTVYEKVGLGNGNQSNNPWLHELPDPISKVTWDSYITMCPSDVKEQGFNEMLRQDIDGSVATLTVNGIAVEMPVYPQPGQAKGTIGVALGYGRKVDTYLVSKEAGIDGGVNAYDFCSMVNNTIQNISSDVSIASANKEHRFAATQIHHTIMGREEYLLRETTLGQYKEDAASNNPKSFIRTNHGKRPVEDIDLWDAHERPGVKWGMVIDMNSCIGCSACVVACTAENNVSVVGKDQISRTRDMFWLRIDRYYSSDMNFTKAKEGKVGSVDMYMQMEHPSDNPKVTFQPIMCQHCNHAPCETVCPVLATSHSTEGLNQMTYNRCIGTRYCANNCPFKVRRFNWYNYEGHPDYANINPAHHDLGKMVLNPDVIVRGRGVMEKCSMCVQRLQAGKLEAKKAGTPIKDGSIQTACQQSCPTNAISFGDLNDAESHVSKERENERNYFLLEELGIKPTVSYLVKVRNQEEKIVMEEEELEEYEEKKEEKKEEGHA
ncbi:MAG: TAT-variant-translocated molybdopterin oxidoreductase [Bacteroidetes bacterium]|nr:TAT-variant-translocated molybdopterin oxidoreductase [Bacteroidota bacterium]